MRPQGRRWAPLAALLAGCAAPEPPLAPEPNRRPPSVAAEPEPGRESPVAPAAPAPADPEAGAAAGASERLGPEILLPAPVADETVDVVGGVAVTRGDVYGRLQEMEPLRASELRELVVLDILVAQAAQRHGITVARAELAPVVAREFELLERRHRAEWGDRLRLDELLAREYGTDPAGYRQRLFEQILRARLRERVIRFDAWQQDRISCRFMVTSDRAVAEMVRDKVQEGASFDVLVRKHSEDPTRDNGGLLPAFGPHVDHPVTRIGFQLGENQLSRIVTVGQGEATRYYLVQCLRRLPARVGSYQELEAELILDLQREPMTVFESAGFYHKLHGR